MLIEDTFLVRDRTAIVTGASIGLGQRFACVLAANGANVLAVARRSDRLEALAAEWPTVRAHQADLSHKDGRAGTIDAAIQTFGTVGVLVNNARYGVPTPSVDEDISQFRSIVELNLTAVFELARLAARHMIDGDHDSNSVVTYHTVQPLSMVRICPMQ